MTQDEKWMAKYNEVKTFIEANKRNHSKYDDTERGLYCNWIRHNRKLLKTGQLKEDRVEKFKNSEERGDGYLFHRKTKSVIINS